MFKWGAAVICGFVAFCGFVWPTLYRYDHINLGQGSTYPVRISRLTGKAEILYPEGWASNKPSGTTSNEKNLTPEVLLKLHGEMVIAPSGLLTLDLYNGSSFSVRKIRIAFSLRNSEHQELWRRSYLIEAPRASGLAPEQTARFETYVGSKIDKGAEWDWKLIGARGTKTDRIPASDSRVSDVDTIERALKDPDFWKLSEPVERVVIGQADWDFARKAPSAQLAWLRQKRAAYYSSARAAHGQN